MQNAVNKIRNANGILQFKYVFRVDNLIYDRITQQLILPNNGTGCLLILTNIIFDNLVKTTPTLKEKNNSASCTTKHLGIIFKDSFKFEKHMSKIINNANTNTNTNIFILEIYI